MQPDLDLPNLNDLISRPEWFARAACRGMDAGLFFPVRGGTAEAARAVCSTCMVRAECLDYAVSEADLGGVWGGVSARERARLRRAVA
jgi:WhiB family redox-sensing transcriptional regulator